MNLALSVILFVRMWVEMTLWHLIHYLHSVILFVRMWVEIYNNNGYGCGGCVILFVRMWVEIKDLVELYRKERHPLREDVSWNFHQWKWIFRRWVILFVRMWVEICRGFRNLWYSRCHPLREDVSWNIGMAIKQSETIVILFVRMWVEILILQMAVFTQSKSSSSWGCELKSWRIRC